jgi:hypothetical protein
MPVTQATPFFCPPVASNTNWCGSKLKNLFRISRYPVENAEARYPAPKVVLSSNTFR